tara:strand:- start:60 stop:503 length:444 start_codon:yes stop_codon:yes gene_type:complete
LLKLLFRKKKRRSSKRKNNQVRKTNFSKRVAIRSNRYLSSKNNNLYVQRNYIYSSIIILVGFLSLSITIFLFTKQIQPFLKNERLKFLCTYQIGEKKNKSSKEAKIKLDKIVGNSDEFCKNFIFPKEKLKRRFNFVPIMKDIILRFI